MSTSKFTTGKSAVLSNIPSMEIDLVIPDLDQLDTVSDDENTTNTDDSFDMADYTLYM